MHTDDYLWFRDSLLVALADEVEPPGWGTLDLEALCKRHDIPFQETWLMVIPQDLEKLGFGKGGEYSGKSFFTINGPGIARASEVRRDRKSKNFLQKLHAVNWNTWVGLASVIGLLIALIALFKAD